jgi:hypothetical protein
MCGRIVRIEVLMLNTFITVAQTFQYGVTAFSFSGSLKKVTDKLSQVLTLLACIRVGAAVAQSGLTTDWTAGFQSPTRIFLLVSASRPALGPTQPLVQWVPGVLSPGVKRGRGVTLTTHPHLVPRLSMSRSYTSSSLHVPPWHVAGQLYFFTCIREVIGCNLSRYKTTLTDLNEIRFGGLV